MQCLVCGGELKIVESELKGHISGYPSGVYPFSLMVCEVCELLQKDLTPAYKAHLDYVYENEYTFFTEEQNILNGGEKDRCECVIKQIDSIVQNGNLKWLDYGCGGGHFLYLLHSLHPEWKLYGYDVSTINKDKLVASANLCDFYLPNDAINEKFDVISINMVLEHLFEPRVVLSKLSSLLSEKGRIVIRIPNFLKYPVDLLIYEHTSHYSLQNLQYLLAICGLELELHIDGIPDIEFAIIARKSNSNIINSKENLQALINGVGGVFTRLSCP